MKKLLACILALVILFSGSIAAAALLPESGGAVLALPVVTDIEAQWNGEIMLNFWDLSPRFSPETVTVTVRFEGGASQTLDVWEASHEGWWWNVRYTFDPSASTVTFFYDADDQPVDLNRRPLAQHARRPTLPQASFDFPENFVELYLRQRQPLPALVPLEPLAEGVFTFVPRESRYYFVSQSGQPLVIVLDANLEQIMFCNNWHSAAEFTPGETYYVYIRTGTVIATHCPSLLPQPDTWQEQLWYLWWYVGWCWTGFTPCPETNTAHINLLDLNNDGVLEFVASSACWDDGGTSVRLIATITDGEVSIFDEVGGGALAFRHKQSGEIRYLVFGQYHSAGYIWEAFLDWDNYAMSINILAHQNEWPEEYFLFEQPVSQREHERFYNRMRSEWEEIPGLGIGIGGVRMPQFFELELPFTQDEFDHCQFSLRQGEQYELIRERVREAFFAALDELAPDGLYVEPIPGLYPAAEPLSPENMPQALQARAFPWLWIALGGSVVLVAVVIALAAKKLKKQGEAA